MHITLFFYKNHFYKNMKLRNAQNLTTFYELLITVLRLGKGKEVLFLKIMQIICFSANVCQFNIGIAHSVGHVQS